MPSPVRHLNETASQHAYHGREADLNALLDQHPEGIELSALAWMGLRGGHTELVTRLLKRPDVQARKADFSFNAFNLAIEKDELVLVQTFVAGGYVTLDPPMGKIYLKEAINHQAVEVLTWLLPQVDLKNCAADLVEHIADTGCLPVAVQNGTEAKRVAIAREIMAVCDPRLNHSAALMTAVRNEDNAMIQLLWSRSDPMDAAEVCIANQQWLDLEVLAKHMPRDVQEKWVQRAHPENLPETATRLRVMRRADQLEAMPTAAASHRRYRG